MKAHAHHIIFTVLILFTVVSGKAQSLTLRTNALYDIALIPNVGAEVNLGKQYTIGLDWFYTWFSSNNRHRYWQGYGGYLTLRKYFDFPEWLTGAPLTGHHVGVYVSALTYDLEWGSKGYQAARFGFGGGIEYGYSFKISKNIKMDLTLGLGFQDGEYKEYEPSNDHYNHYVWLATKKRHWWGPTKLEATFAWFIWGKKKPKEYKSPIENAPAATLPAIEIPEGVEKTKTEVSSVDMINSNTNDVNKKGGGL